ncbi:MAG: phage tail tape measure protein [Candidatus Bathyarchaeia archaeon]|jgi:TP901 family phage tail tape measure protein
MDFPINFRFAIQDSVSSGAGGIVSALDSVSNAFTVAAGVMVRDFANSAMNATIGVAGESSKAFQDYELTLTKIVSATSAVGDEAVQMTADLKAAAEAQTKLGFTGAEAAAGLEALVKAGMTGADATKALTSALSLARLEGIDTETAAGLLVQTLTMFNMTADKSADALNLISKAADAGIGSATDYASGLSNCGAAASNMGLSLSETLGSLVILDKTFGSAVESGTYLNAMFKDLVAKSDELGLTLYNSDGSMKSLDEIVQQLKEHIASYGDDQQSVNEYLSVFDVRAQRAVLGLTNYDGSINSVTTSMDEARDVQDKVNMVMDTSAGKMAELTAEQENVNYQFGEMTAGIELAYKQFALSLGPIGGVVDALGPSMLQGAMTGVMMMVPQLITGIGGMVVSYGLADTASMLLATGTGLLSGALNFLAANPIILIVAAIVGVITALYLAYENCEWFREGVNAVAKTLGDFFKPIIEAVVTALTWLWENVFVPLGRFLADYFVNTVLKPLSLAWEGLKIVAQAVENALRWLWENVLVPLGNFIVSYFVLTVLTPLKIAWTAIQTVASAVGSALKWVWDNVLSPIASFLKNVLLAAWEALANGIKWLYDTVMKPVFDTLMTVYNTLLKPIGDFLSGVGNALGGAGKAISDFFTGGSSSKSNTSTSSSSSPSTSSASNSANKQATIDAAQAKVDAITREISSIVSRLVSKEITKDEYTRLYTAARAQLDAAKDALANAKAMQSGGYIKANNPTYAVIGEGSSDEVVSPVPVMRQIIREETRVTEAAEPTVFEIRPTLNFYGNISSGVSLAEIHEVVSNSIGEEVSKFEAERKRRRSVRGGI